MKKTIKNILIILVTFFISYSLLILFSINFADVTWNFGMSHAIRVGEIPYKDFNIVMTPLYQYLMNGFLLIKDIYLLFLFVQAILVILFFITIYKLIGNKVLILLPIIAFPRFFFILPNYNFLSAFLFLFFLYLYTITNYHFFIVFYLSLLILT